MNSNPITMLFFRAAVEMGFVPCGLRALQPSYRGSQCCLVLEGADGAGPAIHGVRSAGADEKCRVSNEIVDFCAFGHPFAEIYRKSYALFVPQIRYDSLFGSEGESAPDGAEDALETFLIEGGADHNSV